MMREQRRFAEGAVVYGCLKCEAILTADTKG
jgi:hypothetical protein